MADNLSLSLPIRAKSPVENMGASEPAPEQVSLTIRGTRRPRSPTAETPNKAPRVDALSAGTAKPRPDEVAATAPADDQPAEPAPAAGEKRSARALKKEAWIAAIKEFWKDEVFAWGEVQLIPKLIQPRQLVDGKRYDMYDQTRDVDDQLPPEEWSYGLLEQLHKLAKMTAGDGHMAHNALHKAARARLTEGHHVHWGRETCRELFPRDVKDVMAALEKKGYKAPEPREERE